MKSPLVFALNDFILYCKYYVLLFRVLNLLNVRWHILYKTPSCVQNPELISRRRLCARACAYALVFNMRHDFHVEIGQIFHSFFFFCYPASFSASFLLPPCANIVHTWVLRVLLSRAQVLYIYLYTANKENMWVLYFHPKKAPVVSSLSLATGFPLMSFLGVHDVKLTSPWSLPFAATSWSITLHSPSPKWWSLI